MSLASRAASTSRRAAQLIARRPTRAAWAIGAVAAALTAFAVVQIAATNVLAWTATWHGGASMVVYLAPTTTDAQAQTIADSLRASAGVERVEYVAPSEAERRLRASLGGHDELLAGVDPAVLPASLEVELGAGVRDVAGASPIVEALRATPGVDEVEVAGEWVDQVGGVLAALRAAAWALLVVLGGAAVWLVAAALRLRSDDDAALAQVAELLGAPPRFTRVPAMIAGGVQGALGAVLALGLAWALYRSFAEAVVASLARVLADARVAFLPTDQAALLVVMGAGLGLVGGALSGRRARR
jgi:cell division transport system permease protein